MNLPPEDGSCVCFELVQAPKRFRNPKSTAQAQASEPQTAAGQVPEGGSSTEPAPSTHSAPSSPHGAAHRGAGGLQRKAKAEREVWRWHSTQSGQRKHQARFQSSVFFKIKITRCLETIYTRVTKNSRPGISIHRFVNYTHMVTSVLAKKFIGNIHKAL